MFVRDVLRDVMEMTVTLSFHRPCDNILRERPNPMLLHNIIFVILKGFSFDSFKKVKILEWLTY